MGFRIPSIRATSIFFASIKIGLAGLFVFAGLYKFTNQVSFISALSSYPILNPFLGILKYLVPSVEVILGIMLLLNKPDRYAALALAVLLTAFVGLTIHNNAAGMNKDCGCFPLSFILSNTDPIFTLARNMVLLLSSIFIMTAITPVKSRPLFRKQRPFILLFASFLMIGSSATIFFNYSHLKGKRALIIVNGLQGIETAIKGFIGQPLPQFILRGKDGLVKTSDELVRSPYLILILNSLECVPCKNEAIYFQRLSRDFGPAFKYCAIVRPIGRTAILSYKRDNHLAFDFYENLNSNAFSQGVFSSTSTILAISSGKIILTAIPNSHDIGSRQQEFE